MVSCLHDPITEEVKVDQEEEEGKESLKNQSLSEPKKPFLLNDQLDLCLPGLEDFSLSFADSFLDFDSIMDDFGENPVEFGSENGELGIVQKSFEVCNDEFCGETQVKEELIGDGFYGKVASSEGSVQEEGEIQVVKKGTHGFCDTNKVEEELNGDGFCGKLADFGSSIEEELGKVILDGSNGSTSLGVNVNDVTSGGKIDGDSKCGWIDNGNSDGFESGYMVKSNDSYEENCEDVSLHVDELKSGNIVIDNGNEMRTGDSDNDDNESDRDLESESKSLSSSSSSSSSSDDEDEEESGDEKKADNEDRIAGGKLDIEEGEIMLCDADEMVAWSDDEEDEDGGRAMAGPIMSKNELQVLPPVPSVNVTLQPHHQIQPVGIVSSIIGAQVIVEGVENHNPLNEGSIVWITESRSALGIVDEVFGPVKNPYYIVRYNSETDVPANIQQGTLISFVAEFANHVLHDKNIYKKGYDASNENDEEMSDELEFSDDEKEAEYRRMLKMKKRGTNDPKLGTKKKDKRKLKNRSGNWNYDPVAMGKASAEDNKPQIDHDQHLVHPSVGASVDQSSGLAGGHAMVPFAPRAQAPSFYPPNGNWTNGFPGQQPQSMGLPTGIPGNGIQWVPQSHPQQLYQMPLPTSISLQHQSNIIPGLPFNFVLPGGQANFGGGQTFAPWMGQNVFNQSPFGMGLPGQQTSLAGNVEGQAVQPNGPQLGYDPNLRPSPVTSGRPNGRGIGGGGRNAHQNTGGRFGRGRGRHRGR
ncbi:nuclear assembly factor 1 [Abeliophyllum distichum]|uniref:H/ACA ribonucleoprotein complex non-core subunit NAF1 n=1 Tax=Abeliophyllum distichum TaxID=126358 RepID=A0ABD1UHN1_9LAMI